MISILFSRNLFRERVEDEREEKGLGDCPPAAAASSCNAAATFDMTEEESARYAVYKGQEEIVRIDFNWSSVPIFLQAAKKGKIASASVPA